MDNKKIYWLLLAVLGAVFAVMNFLTPMTGDDYAYCFFYDNHSIDVRPTPERVTSFGMALESMWNHYQIVNGRFISHLIIQCFCALWGKTLFNIVNVLVFMAFLHVIVLLSKHKYSMFVLAIAYLVSMCILPFPGQTMLWMTGAINYLWPATAALWYIYWLQRYEPEKAPFWKHIVVGLVGILISWTNESISAPVAFGLFLYFVANRDKFRGLNISAYIGYAIGAALIVFSPGTFSRLDSDATVFQPLGWDQFLFIHSFNTLYHFVHSVLPLIVICVYLVKFIKSKHPMAVFSSLYGCLFLAFVLFLWALGMDDAARVHFGVSVFSLVIILHWLFSVIAKIKANKYVVIALIVLCCVPSYYALAATNKYKVADCQAKTIVENSPSKCIILKPQVPGKSRYCYFGGMETLSPDRYDFHTRVKAMYLEKEYIQALPEDVYNAWENGTLSQLNTVNVMAVPSDRVVRHQAFATYEYPDNTNELLPRQKIVRRLFNTLTTESKKKTYYIEQGDSCFIIFSKDDNANTIELPIMDGNTEVVIPFKDGGKR